ncbi:MAG: hypothetical protein WA700_19370 [Acidobacteriaceae bacterium]
MVRILKRPIFAVSAILIVAMFSTPIAAKSHDYPMRLQVIHSRWHGRHGWIEGFGHGNLMTGQPGAPPKQGMDFEYSCSTPVRHTFAPDTYPARYGKNNLEVVVLLPEMGSTNQKECTLKIEMKDFVYQGGRGGTLWSVPLAGGQPTQIQEDGGTGGNDQ